ncbi:MULTISPECIES: threonine-phosphate decarboxylase CobD [unclassified Leptolyngbya]|uniref:threonine-phosphate decarboxylase CobD n=1 Tax=unclassified Leptolyngbya TaxID=2650499 RepID=UPI00168A1AEA|nr:threonine-phosphate decarboxylase [Leptolyngbya sp. FACHB-8]MBD2155835.1 threonine-phosphate decarboxylase [Leptolyngbya sp. FACHB-16]
MTSFLDGTQPAHGGNLAWAASLTGCSPLSLLDFSASINPLGPPESAIAAIQANLQQLRHYPDPSYRELRHALSQWHKIPAEWILPGNGAAELLTWAGRELAELDATYLVKPGFGDYTRALTAYQGTILPLLLPLDRSSGNLARPFPKVQALPGRTGLIINNPHNPTGYLFSRTSLRPILDQFSLVIVDEAFMDFVGPEPAESVARWVMEFPNLVVIGSLTKFYSFPGLRLGYAIAHPDRLRTWQEWRDPWSVNSLAVAAAIAVLQDHTFQQQTWNWLSGARSQLFEGLQKIPGLEPFPGTANFLLVQSKISAIALQRQLLQQDQILIRDCVSFAELGDRYFRVAVRTQPENQRLLDALQRLVST